MKQVALSIAIISKKYKAIDILLELGANLNKSFDIIGSRDILNNIKSFDFQWFTTDESDRFVYPFLQALFNDDEKMVQYLIQKGYDIHQRFSRNLTILMKIISLKRIKHVKYLQLMINRGVDIELRDDNNYTALEIAIIKNDIESIKCLIQNGKKLNYFDKKETLESPLTVALWGNNFQIAELLMKHGAKDVLPYHAMENSNIPALRFIFSKLLDVKTWRNNINMTALMCAAECAPSTDVLKELINLGADVNEEDEVGTTALVTAVNRNFLQNIEFLVKNGANINHRLKNRQRIINIACQNNATQTLELLLKLGAKINDEEDIVPPIFVSIQNNNLKMARLLVENGSRTDVLFSGSLILKDHVTKQLISETSKAWEIHMETPLIAAIREGRTSIVALLIDNNVDVNFRCQSGMTALFAAILKGDKDIFEILLMGKLNVNQRFSNPKKIKIPINEGETPIELAHRLHRFEFEEALKNYDPDIIHIPQMMMPSFFDFLMKMDK